MKAKDIQFVTCCSTDPPGTYLFNTGTPEQNAQIGTTMAAQVVKDSGGKAHALFVNLPAFAILAQVGVNFKNEMKTLCPGCSVSELDIPLTSVGKDAPDRIVSYLRGHPDVNYVFLVEGALAPGVKAALNAAGLTSKVKLLEQGGDPTSYQELKAGAPWLAATPSAVYGYDYSMVDALARHFAGAPVLQTPPEFWLMTSSAVPPEAISGPAFPLVQDYKAQWTKLWGK
jgi:ribose transport system substrate-binding protein